MNKSQQALECCEKVLEGLEMGTMTISSALLLCIRVARLLNDVDALVWLQYESGGYPRNKDGYIIHEAWQVAYDNGRGSYDKDKKQVVFSETVSQLESDIETQKKAINNFSTSGASVSGEYGFIAMKNLTDTVGASTGTIIRNIADNERKLSILRSKYYDYALKKQIELSFGNVTADVFSAYRENVDNHFSKLSNDTILKLQAIEDKINSDNPEMYSQALATCRRLFENTAVELFDKYYPNYSEKTYKTKSGKEIDVTGDHYINKLSAVIEKLQDKSTNKSLVGTSIIYLLDRIEHLNNLQCKGVHSEVSKQDAIQCIIQTYICLGDILSLQDNSSN